MEFLSSSPSPNFGILEDQSPEDLFQMVFSWQQKTIREEQQLDINGDIQDDGSPVIITKEKNKKKKKRKSPPVPDHDHEEAHPEKKKILHREVERQRRKEMTTLYASLRTLLPLSYLKGKRSISDHMHEAVNYIKHLQSKIQELKKKREDCFKNNTSNLGQSGSNGLEVEHYAQVEEAIVRRCLVGVEVVITTKTTSLNPLPLSAILQVLAKDGLTLVTCVSTKLNQTFVHTILTQVNCWKNMDLLKLQQKLKKLRVPLSYVNNRS